MKTNGFFYKLIIYTLRFVLGLIILSLWCVSIFDLIIGSKDINIFDELKAFREKYFKGEGTIEIGPTLEYLNLLFQFDRQDKSVTISQEAFWNKLCLKFGLTDTTIVPNSPHDHDFMKKICDRNAVPRDIDQAEIEDFASLVMAIFWGAKRSKPELLFDVSVLATQTRHASKLDYKDALKVLRYIYGHQREGIKLKINGDVQLSVFVDSSGSIHSDMRGHGGYIISIGSKCYGGPVDVSSSKAKSNGRSILEYELFSLHTMLPNALHQQL